MQQVEPVVYRDPFGACACTEHAWAICSHCDLSLSPVPTTFFPSQVGWTVLRAAGTKPQSKCESIQQRKDEFQSGRQAAFHALNQAGFKEQLSVPVTASYLTSVIGQNADRSPRWPQGFVGSISHSHNWVLAVAAKTSVYLSIGVDSEAIASPALAELLRNDIGQPTEWELLLNAGMDLLAGFTVLFSAKEAFYKCWYPLHARFLNFDDVVASDIQPDQVSLHDAAHSGLIRLHLKQADDAGLAVRYCITASDVFTITTIDPQGS